MKLNNYKTTYFQNFPQRQCDSLFHNVFSRTKVREHYLCGCRYVACTNGAVSTHNSGEISIRGRSQRKTSQLRHKLHQTEFTWYPNERTSRLSYTLSCNNARWILIWAECPRDDVACPAHKTKIILQTLSLVLCFVFHIFSEASLIRIIIRRIRMYDSVLINYIFRCGLKIFLIVTWYVFLLQK